VSSTYQQEQMESEEHKSTEVAFRISVLNWWKTKYPVFRKAITETSSRYTNAMLFSAGGGAASTLHGTDDPQQVHEWRKSVLSDEANLQIVGGDFAPLYELVKLWNPAKGVELEAYQKDAWDERSKPIVSCADIPCGEFSVRSKVAKSEEDCCLHKYSMAKTGDACADGYEDLQNWKECRLIMQHAAYEQWMDGTPYNDFREGLQGYSGFDKGLRRRRQGSTVSGCFISAKSNMGFFNPKTEGAKPVSESRRLKICRLQKHE